MDVRRMLLPAATAMLIGLVAPASAAPAAPARPAVLAGQATVTRLVTGLAGGSGSTIGPDGALYVPEPVAGRISRVDPATGTVTTFASGLPRRILGVGGAMDVAFLDGVAYVLVTLVGPDVGGYDTVGVYRVDGPHSLTVVADIGAFAAAHPPRTDFVVPSGVQYAMEAYRGAFLVTDGHHNRVLRVTRTGQVSEVIAFGNIVPTGLDVRGHTVYMAEAGPLPHLPENGRVVSFEPGSDTASPVAAGGRLLVDVELGPRRAIYALSQGIWPLGGPAGSPALPNTGKLLKADGKGGFTTLAEGLDRPTSMELVRDTAYVVSLGGDIWTVTNISGAGGRSS